MDKSEIKAVLRSAGWVDDRFGNSLSASGNVRVHFNAISLRVEAKTANGWVKYVSSYFKDVSVFEGSLRVGSKVLKLQVS